LKKVETGVTVRKPESRAKFVLGGEEGAKGRIAAWEWQWEWGGRERGHENKARKKGLPKKKNKGMRVSPVSGARSCDHLGGNGTRTGVKRRVGS